VSGLGPDFARRLRDLQELELLESHHLRIAGEVRHRKKAVLAELIAALPKETPTAPRPGRPLLRATPAQIAEVLRLKHTNGKIGLRVIGERVGLSWHLVQRILDEHAPSENTLDPSENPGPVEQGEIA
jgi:hypothetical protein